MEQGEVNCSVNRGSGRARNVSRPSLVSAQPCPHRSSGQGNGFEAGLSALDRYWRSEFDNLNDAGKLYLRIVCPHPAEHDIVWPRLRAPYE